MNIAELLSPTVKKPRLMTSFFSVKAKESEDFIVSPSEQVAVTASSSAIMDKNKREILHELRVVNAIKQKDIMKKKANKAKLKSPLMKQLQGDKKKRNNWSKRRNEILTTIAGIRKEVFLVTHKQIGITKILEHMKSIDYTITSVDQSMICRWMRVKRSELKKAGRKVNSEFESAVIFKLFVTQLTKKGTIEILANDCFRHAAGLVLATGEFAHCPLVKRLLLTNRWVHGLKKRYELRKRRCTTIIKPKPSLERIQEFYTDLHNTVQKEEVEADFIFNEDETAIFSCPELLHQYVNKTAHRAVSPFGGDEGRFTALLGSSSNGKMLPVMMILKVDTKNTFDLTTERTLKRVQQELNLQDWEYFVHEVTITGPKTGVLYYLLY